MVRIEEMRHCPEMHEQRVPSISSYPARMKNGVSTDYRWESSVLEVEWGLAA